MKRILFLILLTAAMASGEELVWIRYTHFTWRGTPPTEPLIITPKLDPKRGNKQVMLPSGAFASGKGFSVDPEPGGGYHFSLVPVPILYTATVDGQVLEFPCPDQPGEYRMEDLITNKVTYEYTGTLSRVYGTKVSRADTQPDFLINKIKAGTGISLLILTDTNGAQSMEFSSTNEIDPLIVQDAVENFLDENPIFVTPEMLDQVIATNPGPAGPVGPAGPAGSDGLSATVAIDSVVMLGAGTNAWVTNVGTVRDVRLRIGIPQGAAGAQGLKGDTGMAGSNGYSATLMIDSFVTLGAGTNAWVTNVGTATDVHLRIGIPQGAAGVQGIKGDPGIAGSNGVSPTIVIDSLVTLGAGTNAWVTNVGTATDVHLQIGIPAGATGAQGPKGDTGAAGRDGVDGVTTVQTITSGDGFGLTNLNGAAIKPGTVNSNSFDLATRSLLGTGGGAAVNPTGDGSALTFTSLQLNGWTITTNSWGGFSWIDKTNGLSWLTTKFVPGLGWVVDMFLSATNIDGIFPESSMPDTMARQAALNTVSNNLTTVSNSLLTVSNGLTSVSNNLGTLSNSFSVVSNGFGLVSNSLSATSNGLVVVSNGLSSLSNSLTTVSNSLTIASNIVWSALQETNSLLLNLIASQVASLSTKIDNSSNNVNGANIMNWTLLPSKINWTNGMQTTPGAKTATNWVPVLTNGGKVEYVLTFTDP